MALPDTVQHFLTSDGIRLTVASIDTATKIAQSNHDLSELPAGILAQVITGAVLLANDFKNKEGVSLKWYTSGSAGIIYADAYDGQFVRGYADCKNDSLERYSPQAESDALGTAGKLVATRYSLLRTPYISAIDLSVSSVADGIETYVMRSDQTLSSVKTFVNFDASGKLKQASGYMAQLLPEGNAKRFDSLFSKRSFYDMKKGSKTSLDEMIEKEGFILLSQNKISFRCTCSEDRIRQGILILPPEEQKALLQDDVTEVACHYCGKIYQFPRDLISQWIHDHAKEVNHD